MQLNELQLLNVPPSTTINQSNNGNILTIRTCQRVMIISMTKDINIYNELIDENNFYRSTDAYKFLLETVCGLKSKILGEYEIVSQFKVEIQKFISLDDRDSRLIKIMEKLLKDAKEVRTKHLLGIGQLSYSGISRKILINNGHNDKSLLITGTGKMAEDLIKLLYKKYDITVCGRNQTRLKELESTYLLKTTGFEDKNKILEFSQIINTVGAETILFNPLFFENWAKRHDEKRIFLDLGSPSTIDTFMNKAHKVYRLKDIFDETSKLSESNLHKINCAHIHILSIVEKRSVICHFKRTEYHSKNITPIKIKDRQKDVKFLQKV